MKNRIIALETIIIVLLLFFIASLYMHDPYDLNKDGVVNSADLLRLKKHILEEE